ncbi:MAG TPA: CHASE sensor domain-containing protein, partial [Candidatus Saccharimonadales bacterium]|nr:CHASE sensor domain-containing protein [Candidatus Saccharimonadales bacterium]
MIQWLRLSTIKRKLTLIIMLTCSVALILACTAILVFEHAGTRQMLKHNTEVMANVIGANSSGALSFKDKSAAKETLAALRAEPYVLSACLYNREGEIFATYYREGTKVTTPPAVGVEGPSFGATTLNLFHKITFDGEVIGTVLIRSDLRLIEERLRTYLGIIGFVMLSATIVALLLSLRLQGLISGPIMHLADTANQVASQKNYSIRAAKISTDEMGVLIDRFNEMLSGIQERDAALSLAQTGLEKRVDERTKELQLEISERSRVEAELRVSRQKFETLVNSIQGVVWEADPITFAFSFVSEQAERLLGYPRDLWISDPSFWLSHFHPDDQQLAQNFRKKGLEKEKPSQFEYRMIAADGRAVWLREISTFTIEAGVPKALRGVLFDITEHKQAEEELELLNKRLLETSRFAGMAEVATAVLHNVGNVLNSVNVSSTLICNQVRNSRNSRLRDVILLLNRHSGDLADFLTNDPKGKIIPSYLSNLSEQLGDEQQDLLKELELLVKNIEHIKEIVAMQQDYARVSGIIETLSIRDLVEDALQMHTAALARHGILVIREYQDVPVISMDKHKVLQILVNL